MCPGANVWRGAMFYHGAAIAEAGSIRGEDVFIVGAADSAGRAAISFSTVARCVTMLVCGAVLSASMSHYLIERIESTPNIHVRYWTALAEMRGEDRLESLVLNNTGTGVTETVETSALFVFIGVEPLTDWLGVEVVRDEPGYILTGPDMLATDRRSWWPLKRDPMLPETSIPGVFAAGDVRHGSGKRDATARACPPSCRSGSSAPNPVWRRR